MDAESTLGQFALAAAAVFFATQIVKAVLPYLMGKREEARAAAGERSVDFWRGVQREIVRDALAESVIPILQQQAAILAELKTLASGEESAHLRLQLGVESLQAGQDKARESLHRINEKLQVVTDRRPLP